MLSELGTKYFLSSIIVTERFAPSRFTPKVGIINSASIFKISKNDASNTKDKATNETLHA